MPISSCLATCSVLQHRRQRVAACVNQVLSRLCSEAAAEPWLGFSDSGNKRGFAGGGREVHKWQITDSSAGPGTLGCAFGRMQSFSMPYLQGYNLICQDGAKPVLPSSFAPTYLCADPAKMAATCKGFAGGK